MQMVEWPTVTVAEVASEVTVGHVGPMADEYVEEGIPFLRSLNVEPFNVKLDGVKYISENFHHKLKKSSLAPGDVVVVRTGKPGACAIIPSNLPQVNCSDLVIIRCGERVRPRYLCYIINSVAAYHIDSHLVGAVQQHFNVAAARTINFNLPPLNIQDSTLALLGSLDDKIDLNRRMNETLEAMARAIFKDWFVDFGPTRAKMEGRATYLTQWIWDLFPDALDGEGKPMEWDRKQACDIIEFNPSEKLKKGEPAQYLDMAALPTQGASPVPPIDREFTSGTKFRNGDTLLARITPCLENGKTAFVQCLDGESTGWGSTEFIVMRSIYPVPKPYSYILARDHDFRRHAIQSMTGTSGRQRATTDAIAAYPVTTPGVEGVWLALGALIDPIFQKIAANADESRTLAQTRDLLLPKLMSGEIRVKDAEKAVEQAL